MTEDSLIAKITDIIIEQTVNKKIPTVVFMSVKKEDLVKNLFWTLKSGNKDESTFTHFTTCENIPIIGVNNK